MNAERMDKGYLGFKEERSVCRAEADPHVYWSLSKYVKDFVKSSVNFIGDFEKILVVYARQQEYDGIICGHIHKAQIRKIDEIDYLNCGEGVESGTAVVETLSGEWKSSVIRQPRSEISGQKG